MWDGGGPSEGCEQRFRGTQAKVTETMRSAHELGTRGPCSCPLEACLLPITEGHVGLFCTVGLGSQDVHGLEDQAEWVEPGNDWPGGLNS